VFLFSGVWDAKLKQRVVGFTGLFILFMVGYFGALASGFPIAIRLFL
jgi:hypothetical protein